MTYEPQNAFEFTGYWLALSLSEAQQGMIYPGSRVGFYGGTVEDTQAFSKKVAGMEFDEATDEFLTNAPEGAILGSGIVVVPENDEHPDLLFMHSFDYRDGTAGALVIPFAAKTASRPFSFGDPEILEVWGPFRDNETFWHVALFSMLAGLKQHPAFPTIYQGFTGSLLKNSN
jgi:hypothetical protein